jgi:hypothetical protein
VTLTDALEADLAMCRRHSAQQNLTEAWWAAPAAARLLRALGDERVAVHGVVYVQQAAEALGRVALHLGTHLADDPELPGGEFPIPDERHVLVNLAGVNMALVAIRMVVLDEQVPELGLGTLLARDLQRAVLALGALVEPEAAA